MTFHWKTHVFQSTSSKKLSTAQLVISFSFRCPFRHLWCLGHRAHVDASRTTPAWRGGMARGRCSDLTQWSIIDTMVPWFMWARGWSWKWKNHILDVRFFQRPFRMRRWTYAEVCKSRGRCILKSMVDWDTCICINIVLTLDGAFTTNFTKHIWQLVVQWNWKPSWQLVAERISIFW